MANEEHVEILKQDVGKWNVWRRKNPELWPDLSGADLNSTKLSNANLRRAYLRGADLNEADLNEADLSFADLRFVDLSNTNLSDANLSDANLWNAHLVSANLSFANLNGADLSFADLRFTNLIEADLRFAHLISANLSFANLWNAHLSTTVLYQIDLRLVKELDVVDHQGPSSVDLNTVQLPQGPTRTHFLKGVGFPDTIIEYYDSLFTMPLQFSSCFLSYAHEDEAFARRLYKDLQDKGVRCWFAPHDIRPGDYHHERINEAIHVHERTLLLLSDASVKSTWVKHEVQTALAHEISQDRTILFPIRLDETVLTTTQSWAVQLRETRHIGDFTQWEDERVYQQRFAELLHHLKVEMPLGG